MTKSRLANVSTITTNFSTLHTCNSTLFLAIVITVNDRHRNNGPINMEMRSKAGLQSSISPMPQIHDKVRTNRDITLFLLGWTQRGFNYI